MKFIDVLASCDYNLINDTDSDITNICYDSRKVVSGDLFVATSGTNTDGARYITDAIKKGAVAIVSDKEIDDLPKNIGYAISNNTRKALGLISSNFFGNPSSKLNIVGVTGTSGKTTVTNIIHSIYTNLGEVAGLIGTIANKIGTEAIPSTHTTPESRDLQELFAKMVSENASICAMETSSHALDQGRVYGTEFNIGVFLNIARDHLDYHKTIEAYKEAKLKLFSYYPNIQKKEFVAVINNDENILEDIKRVFNGKILTFGQTSDADVYSTNEEVSISYVKFTLNYNGESVDVTFNMGGDFNVSNALAAATVAIIGGVSLEDIKYGIEHCGQVSGRFQSIDCGQDFSIIVDYAHTPDEMEKLLETSQKIKKNRIITVFGCGGNRDRGKRPIMGKIACDNSDFVIITSDNPRNEEPIDIIRDIVAGIEDDSKYTIVSDRHDAIEFALKMAQKDDLVVLAGKGHENYQIVKDDSLHFDDKEEVEKILKNL